MVYNIGDEISGQNYQEAPVDAEAEVSQVAPGYLVYPKARIAVSENVEGTSQAALEFTQRSVDPQDCASSLEFLPPVTTSLGWQLAVVSAPNQARRSERTRLPGARWRLAVSEIASELKPFTAVILA